MPKPFASGSPWRSDGGDDNDDDGDDDVALAQVSLYRACAGRPCAGFIRLSL